MNFKRRGRKIFFEFNNTYYVVIFSNFLFTKKKCKIFDIKGSEVGCVKIGSGFLTKQYEVFFREELNIVRKKKGEWQLKINDDVEIRTKLISNRDFIFIKNDIKVGVVLYNNNNATLKVDNEFNFLKFYLVVIFLAVSSNRFLRSFVGDPFDIET